MNLKVYSVLVVLSRLFLYGAVLATIFMTNKYLGWLSIGVVVLGFIAEELKYREQLKLQEKAASEFMQMIASKTGTGSC